MCTSSSWVDRVVETVFRWAEVLVWLVLAGHGELGSWTELCAQYWFAMTLFAMCCRHATMLDCEKFMGNFRVRCVMAMHRKTPQSYAFSCLGDRSGPSVLHDDHDHIGWWYVVKISWTRLLSACTYLTVFRAGVGLEF